MSAMSASSRPAAFKCDSQESGRGSVGSSPYDLGCRVRTAQCVERVEIDKSDVSRVFCDDSSETDTEPLTHLGSGRWLKPRQPDDLKRPVL